MLLAVEEDREPEPEPAGLLKDLDFLGIVNPLSGPDDDVGGAGRGGAALSPAAAAAEGPGEAPSDALSPVTAVFHDSFVDSEDAEGRGCCMAAATPLPLVPLVVGAARSA